MLFRRAMYSTKLISTWYIYFLFFYTSSIILMSIIKMLNSDINWENHWNQSDLAINIREFMDNECKLNHNGSNIKVYIYSVKGIIIFSLIFIEDYHITNNWWNHGFHWNISDIWYIFSTIVDVIIYNIFNYSIWCYSVEQCTQQNWFPRDIYIFCFFILQVLYWWA